MKTIIVVNRISLVLVSLFCCHGLTDGITLKGRKIEENSNFVVLFVESKLMPMDYLISFFDPSITMLDIPNKSLDHKFKINKSTVAPLILYETSTQIPDPNGGKRVIRQADTADGLLTKANLTKANLTKSAHDVYNNTLNSTAEHSMEKIDHIIKLYILLVARLAEHSTGMIDTMLNGVSNCTSYILTIKDKSMKMIDNMLDGVSKRASYLMIKQRNIDLIPTICAGALIGGFVGILLVVAVRANQLRNARREADLQMPEDICMYMV